MRFVRLRWHLAGLVLLGTLAPWKALEAQVLIVSPPCGAAGSAAQIKGSGWAEPAPPCEYIYFFDGVEFAPRKPDGLYGPPDQGVTIPGGAAEGDHTIKVELRLYDSTLIQCRQVKFKVVNAVNNPWKPNTVTGGGRTINMEFNSKDVCDVTPCTKIVFAQVVKNLGNTVANGSGVTRALTYAEQGFGNAANLDGDRLADGSRLDNIWGHRDPYYNGDDPAERGWRQGRQPTDGTHPSRMNDTPNYQDGFYPADIHRIIWEFETNAFCAAGDDRGTWLGRMTWKWERPRGGPVTITHTAGTRDQPTAGFLAALNQWNVNALHRFTMPTPRPPTTGGMPCN